MTKCKKCGAELTAKESILASVNQEDICSSCWSRDILEKISYAKVEENIASIPDIHRSENRDLYLALFLTKCHIERHNAYASNILLTGRSGSLKTTLSYSYLKEVWKSNHAGMFATFNECIKNIDEYSSYKGYLVIDDALVTLGNNELLTIIDLRINRGLHTLVNTTVSDLNDFGDKLYNRFNKYFIIIPVSR